MTAEVYTAYYKMRRRERYLDESDLIHGKVLFSNFDREDLTGEPLEEYQHDRDLSTRLRVVPRAKKQSLNRARANVKKTQCSSEIVVDDFRFVFQTKFSLHLLITSHNCSGSYSNYFSTTTRNQYRKSQLGLEIFKSVVEFHHKSPTEEYLSRPPDMEKLGIF